MTAAVLVGISVGCAVSSDRSLLAAAGAGLLWYQPAGGTLAAVGLLVGSLWWVKRLGRLEAEMAVGDLSLLGELVSLGLSAGLPPGGALSHARTHIHPALAAEVGRVLRAAHHTGLATALRDATGHGERLYRVMAQAVATGATLGTAVRGFIREAEADLREARLTRARRLPVRLIVPLALLILPGFVLLIVGPTLITSLDRLSLPQ